MHAEQVGQNVHVAAAVGIRRTSGLLKQESFVVVNEDSNRLIFINKAEKGVQEDCFTIDGVFTLDTGQDKLFLEQLQPLLSMGSLGYSMSLLVYDAHHCEAEAKIQNLVQKVIEFVFQESSSAPKNVQFLKTISFVQIYSDGQAQDLLSPKSQVLQVMDLPPLGLVAEEATEIIVTDSQTATHFYHQGVSVYQGCFHQPFQNPHKPTCGILFTITIEAKEAGNQELQRATVRIFEFLGGNEQPCTDLFLPISWASSSVPLSPEAGFLSWIVKQLLEDNTLTFLLFCLTLPDASGEEILSAISLIKQVRTVRKRVAPIHWDPTQEARKQRAAIAELRTQLFLSDRAEQSSIIFQLEKMIKELQVLKSQNWEKKKEKSANGMKEGHISLAARVQISSETEEGEKFGNQPRRQQNQNDTHQEKEMTGGRIPNIQYDQVGDQEKATKDKHFTIGASKSSHLTLEGTSQPQSPSSAGEQHQNMEVKFLLAKAKRQHLKTRHQFLIQQELLRVEKKQESQEKSSPVQQEALLWHEEKPLLTLRMEMLQKEQEEAEKDLEELYQEYQHETNTQKQHFLQVFQAFKRHAEEWMNALEKQYRKLLQESLQDAIILSSQNQQLRDQKQLAFTEAATQTDFPALKDNEKDHSIP